MRVARKAARVVAPVAMPSSITIAVCAFDVGGSAIAQIAPAAPLDFGKFGVANGLEVGFRDGGLANDVLVAHDNGRAAVDDRAHRQFRLERHADLAHQNQIERGVERRGDLRRDRDAAAR